MEGSRREREKRGRESKSERDLVDSRELTCVAAVGGHGTFPPSWFLQPPHPLLASGDLPTVPERTPTLLYQSSAPPNQFSYNRVVFIFASCIKWFQSEGELCHKHWLVPEMFHQVLLMLAVQIRPPLQWW